MCYIYRHESHEKASAHILTGSPLSPAERIQCGFLFQVTVTLRNCILIPLSCFPHHWDVRCHLSFSCYILPWFLVAEVTRGKTAEKSSHKDFLHCSSWSLLFIMAVGTANQNHSPRVKRPSFPKSLTPVRALNGFYIHASFSHDVCNPYMPIGYRRCLNVSFQSVALVPLCHNPRFPSSTIHFISFTSSSFRWMCSSIWHETIQIILDFPGFPFQMEHPLFKKFCGRYVQSRGQSIFHYLFLATLGLCDCTWAFSSRGNQGLLFILVQRRLLVVASPVAEHRLQGMWASVIVARGLTCPVACEIFPDQGSNPCPLHWQADS